MSKIHRNGRATAKTSIEDEIVHLRGLDLKGLRARWQSNETSNMIALFSLDLCAQSDTNRSPCYLANIRVIFEKNSERITKSPRSARRPVVFHFLGKFENREKQGASIGANREMSLPIQVRKSSERPCAAHGLGWFDSEA